MSNYQQLFFCAALRVATATATMLLQLVCTATVSSAAEPSPPPPPPSVPIFLTFDSRVAPSSINGSAAQRVPYLDQLTYVWGSSVDGADADARRAAYRAAAPLAKLSYYMPYSRAPAASRGFDLAFWNSYHPEWVLYKCDRKTVAFWDGQTAQTGSVPLDFTNPEVVEWQVLNQSAHAVALGYDAMAFDNFGGGARQKANSGKACGVISPNGSWSPRFSGTGSSPDPLFAEASIVWLETISKRMKLLTPSLGIIPNLCLENGEQGVDHWFQWNSSEAKRVAAASTAMLSERGFTAWGGGSGVARIEEDELLNELSWMQSLASQGKGYFSINEVTPQNVGSATNDWVLACFLLGKAKDVRNQALWISGVQEYGNWSYRPNLAVEIGQPLATGFRTLAAAPGGSFFLRNYSAGVVVVNAKSVKEGGVPVVVTLDPSRKYADARGAPLAVPQITLAPQSGAVLVFCAS